MIPIFSVVSAAVFALLLRYARHRHSKKATPQQVPEADNVIVADSIVVAPLPPPLPTIKPTMANFDIAYDIVANHEGGYQRIVSDPGNYNSQNQLVGTNWGISAKTYEDVLGYPPSERQMRDLSKSEAKSIYKLVFWDGILGDRIRNQQLANFMFDGYVNHRSTGVRLMQRVLGVTVDGGFGPRTLAALNAANPALVFDAFKSARINFYHRYANSRPEMKTVWLPVWLRRMDSFNYLRNSKPPPNDTSAEYSAMIMLPIGLAALWWFSR